MKIYVAEKTHVGMRVTGRGLLIALEGETGDVFLLLL